MMDKLLASNGVGTLGKALRDSVINAFGAVDESPQDVFTVFEYRHVHRNDWDKLKAALLTRCVPLNRLFCDPQCPNLTCYTYFYRWRQFTTKVFPADVSDKGCVDIDDDDDEEQKPSWETEPELKLRTYPYMIFPVSMHKILWDYLIIALVAFNVLELPFTIAFGSEACDVCSRLCSICAIVGGIQTTSQGPTRFLWFWF